MRQATSLLLLGAFFLSLHLCSAVVPIIRCEAGGKVKTSQTKLDQPIRKFVWLNDTNGNVEAVFVLTRGRTVWRSTDEGKTFERLDTRLPPPIDDIIITSNYKKIYFLQFRGKLWTTEDQGENFKLATSDLMIQSVRAHPTQANWALAQVLSPACVPTPRDGCSLDLYLTQDFGASWERKVRYVAEEQYDWGGAGKDGVPVGNVFYINFPQATATSNQYTIAANRFDQVFQRTSDLFRTFDSPRPHTVAFKYLAKTVVTAELTSANDESLLALYGSHDDGNTFSKCMFPTSLNERSYHIADLSEGTAIVSVDHAGGGGWATTYISDNLITKFSTISNYTRRSSSGKSDIRRVQSLQGIYVTNRFIVDNENDPVNEDTPLTSAITFDKGGLWQPLAAPARDKSGAPPCSGCNINLVPFSQTRRGSKALYSREDTPGLLLATGSVGPWLDDSRDKINTYISRDGGMTWSQLTNGEYTYEIADYGSLILLMKATEATYTLMYSWDQGLSTTECAFTFSTSPLEVKEIYNSPSGKDLSFIIYGTSGRDSYLVHVDFTNSDTRLCDAQTDYEKWSPSDAHDDQCLMGQKITYTRRKQDSKCYNNVNYAKPGASVSPCACDREDFQCDYCFEPDKSSPGRCILDADCPTDPLAKPTQCLGTWNKTQGYRLVPGNKCRMSSSNYNNYAPVATKCTGGDGGDGGGDGSGGLSGGAIFGILVLVFFVLASVLAVVGFVLYKVNPEFKDFVTKHMPSLPSFSVASNKDYAGSGSHEYSRLNSSEPQSLLDDLEGDDNGGLDDDDLLDEAPEIDDKSLSNFTNQNAKKDKNEGGDADSLI